MAPNDLLRNRVRARPEPEDIDESGDEVPGSDQSSDALDSENASQADSESDIGENASQDEEASTHSDESTSLQTNLNDISFGALAQAQASLGKRKRPSTSDSQTPNALETLRKRLRESKETADEQPDSKTARREKPPSRTSKHAPTALSSKFAVTRKRVVIEPASSLKPRDPRFDESLQDHQARAANTAAVSKNYAFLSSYQESEMAGLRTQARKTKDPDAGAELKRTLMSMDNRRKAAEAAELEREIQRRHRKKEKELIKEGKKEKPWFLKKGDVKKEVLVEKFKGMKDKEREKVLAKRRKRKASKEKKGMPMERRGFEVES